MDSFATRIVGDLRAPSPRRSRGRTAASLMAHPPRSRVPWPAIALGAGLVRSASRCSRAGARGAGQGARRHGRADGGECGADAFAPGAGRYRQGPVQCARCRATPAPAAAPAAAASSPAAPARVEPVPFGEMPLDRGRLDALRELLSKLEAQGAHGVVRIASYAGLFCLSGNATDGYLPANSALPLARCDLIGNPPEDSLVRTAAPVARFRESHLRHPPAHRRRDHGRDRGQHQRSSGGRLSRTLGRADRRRLEQGRHREQPRRILVRAGRSLGTPRVQKATRTSSCGPRASRSAKPEFPGRREARSGFTPL